MEITKNDLIHIDTVLEWKRPETEGQQKAIVDYVEFEVLKPERFKKLAQNIDRCGSKDKWLEEEWKDINDENGDSYEYIVIYVHILPLPWNEYNVDKVYVNCRSANDSCLLETEKALSKEEMEIIMEEAVRLVKEAKR